AVCVVASVRGVSVGGTLGHCSAVKGLAGLGERVPVDGLSLIHARVITVLRAFMIMWSVARVGAPLTVQLGLLGPVSLLFLAWMFLGEPITAPQVAGPILVVISAVVLGRRPGTPPPPVPDPSRKPA